MSIAIMFAKYMGYEKIRRNKTNRDLHFIDQTF
jgi:hypothetical protein